MATMSLRFRLIIRAIRAIHAMSVRRDYYVFVYVEVEILYDAVGIIARQFLLQSRSSMCDCSAIGRMHESS